MAASEVATEWAGQLATLAETLLDKVPVKEEFTNIRGILEVWKTLCCICIIFIDRRCLVYKSKINRIINIP